MPHLSQPCRVWWGIKFTFHLCDRVDHENLMRIFDVSAMELCFLNPEKANVENLVQAISNGKSQEWFDKAACWSIIPCKFSRESWAGIQPQRAEMVTNLILPFYFAVNTLNIRTLHSQFLDVEEKCQYATSFTYQFCCLLRRKIQIEMRDPVLS